MDSWTLTASALSAGSNMTLASDGNNTLDLSALEDTDTNTDQIFNAFKASALSAGSTMTLVDL